MSEVARQITGMTAQELMEYDWPSINSVNDCFGYEMCRDVQLSAGMVVGRDEIRAEWDKATSRILTILRKASDYADKLEAERRKLRLNPPRILPEYKK